MTEATDSQEKDAPREDEEAAARAFVERMETHPAVSCGFRFSSSLTEEIAHNVVFQVRAVAQLLKEKHSWLDLSRLKDVFFYTDYLQGLRDAVGPNATPPAPTMEVGGLSLGMHLHRPEGACIVMQEAVAQALASDIDEHYDFGCNVLRHELCHVHDDAFKRELIERDGITFARDAMESRFLPMSEALWAEYFANKYSHGKWSDANADLQLLSGAVASVREDVRQSILRYRTSSNDLDTLLSEVEPKARFLIQCFGYASGRLAGAETSLSQLAPDLEAQLKVAGLSQSWNVAIAKLDELDARRPNWGSYWAISELNTVGIAVMEALGLRYRPEGDGLYVDVPFSADTLPGLAGVAWSLDKLMSSINVDLENRLKAISSSSNKANGA